MPITVSLIEDSDEIRESLTVLLRASPGFALSGAYRTAEEALSKLPQAPPEVLLVDINLPGLSGIDCVRKLKRQLPGLQVLMLTVYDDPDAIFDSLSAGASGYLLKRTSPAKLLEAITEVSQGGSPMSAQIARKVVQRFALPATEPSLGLTPRKKRSWPTWPRGSATGRSPRSWGSASRPSAPISTRSTKSSTFAPAPRRSPATTANSSLR
jgi:DNA-binding NarL/FixJ family response regulator